METKTRILAADSNKDFCRQITELNAQEGDMEIVGTASDGVETLALLSEEKPDILLLDLVLPKLDGLEVLRRLPETGAKCRTIVLSGFVNNKVISDCTNYGVKKANAAIADNAADKDQAAGRARELFHACRGNRLPRIVRGRTRRRAA